MIANPEIWRIRRRVQEYLYQMAAEEINGLVSTYPNSGKTFGSLKIFEDDEHQGTILQPNRDLRSETKEIAEETLGIDVLDLPSFPHDSPLMDEDADAYNEQVVNWYERGMPPRDIYRHVEAPEGDRYHDLMDVQYTAYDLVLGDPVHSSLERVDRNRTVMFDDVNLYGSFVTKYDFSDESIMLEVKEYLKYHKEELNRLAEMRNLSDPVPMSLTEVFRAPEDSKTLVNEFVQDNESRDIIHETDFVTASTSQFIRVITAKDAWQTAIEWEDKDECIKNGVKVRGVFVPEDDAVLIGQFPLNLREAKNVIMLGATPIFPVVKFFFKSVGLEAVHEDPITEEEKQLYFDQYLNMKIVQTTDFLRPASGNNSVKIERLKELVFAYRKTYGKSPLIISSKKFLDANEGWLNTQGLDYIHFAKAIGTNKFDDVTDCIVFGCPHYGDDYVRQMAAFCEDFEAEPIRNQGEATYWSTEIAQEIYQNMTAGSVFQALMRVGRSTTDRTRVWVETSAILDYVPRVKHIVHGTTDSESQVLKAIMDEAKSVRDIINDVDCSRTNVYRSLWRLKDLGIVEVKGRSDYNAETFGIIADGMEQGIIEAVAESSNIIIQSCNTVQEIEAEIKQRDGILVSYGGTVPERVDRALVEAIIERVGMDIPLTAYD